MNETASNIKMPLIHELDALGVLKGSYWTGRTGSIMEVKHRYADPVTELASYIVFTDGNKCHSIDADQVIELINSGRLQQIRKRPLLDS